MAEVTFLEGKAAEGELIRAQCRTAPMADGESVQWEAKVARVNYLSIFVHL